MLWTREELKTKAKIALKRSYWPAFFASLICAIIQSGASVEIENELVISSAFLFTVLGFLVKAFVVNPLDVGSKIFYLHHAEEKASVADITKVFSRPGYMNIVKIMFVRDIKVVLWTLLLIIPGVIKSYEYQMIPYLLAEYDDITMDEAFQQTKVLMSGHKMSSFVLYLSFFGWLMLGALCLGIGTFFVLPYMDATFTQLYLTLKERQAYSTF